MSSQFDSKEMKRGARRFVCLDGRRERSKKNICSLSEIEMVVKTLCELKPCCLEYLMKIFDVKYHHLLKKICLNTIWYTETGYPCKDKCIK